MARHVLTLAERIRGTRVALSSSKTPAHLKPGLRVSLERLERGLKRAPPQERHRRKRARAGLLDWLRL